MMGAIKRADELNVSIANSIILAQFDNPANPLAHYEGTGVEILESGIELDAFVAAVGTGGSISGTAKRLRESIEDLRVFAVEPIKSAVLSGEGASSHGIQGIGAGFVPQVCDTSIYDEIVKVSDEDAYEMARLLAKDEGLLVGISAGANVWASLQVAQRGEFKSIVTILPDTGERYLSTKLFDL
jgi:cysteine synthase A